MSKRNISALSHLRTWSVLFILILFVLPACSDDDGVGPVDNPGIPEIEQRVYNLVNQHRVDIGLAPLTMSDIITAQARNHSRNMADGSVPFSHDGFEARVDAIKAQIDLTAAAENVATNSGYSDPALVAVNSWLKSNGHRENIEGNYDLTGIGVAQSSTGGYFLTQIFVKQR